MVDYRKECGRLCKKLILLAHGPTTDLNLWTKWCRELHGTLPEDFKERRRILK
jgi:hypothetical protein